MKRKRKGFFNKIRESIIPIMQISIMIVAFAIPYVVNISNLIGEKIDGKINATIEEIVISLLLSYGNIVIGLFLFCATYYRVRKKNKDRVFNHLNNVYHDYPYWWYLFCAKILGYNSCNLILVPIHMQYKLVLNSVFNILEPGEYPKKEDDTISVRETKGTSYNSSVVNLVFIDTYLIQSSQLPDVVKEFKTIYIQRYNGDNNRYQSEKFVNEINNVVRKLPSSVEQVNIFSTTNPWHTYQIASNVFTTGDRNNIQRIVVYQQEKDGNRIFGKKGKIVKR